MNLQQSLKIIPIAAQNVIKKANFQPQNIIIDFSSPNIAKPFHFGHLKSTILGNFLANLTQYLGNHVTRLNYIGDWGTQYGLLSLGLDSLEIASLDYDTLNLDKLLEVYVEANKRGQEDEVFYNEARRRFHAIDSGQDDKLVNKWRLVRDRSLDELKKSYDLLGVKFDIYEHESDHAKRARDLVNNIESGITVTKDKEGVVLTQVIKNDKTLSVPLLKSDGSSLYITRDIVAAISRREKYNFDKMYYVVGADQAMHFHNLREIIRNSGHSWADDLVHVKVGKVMGMSSRSGQSVLLSKIIDEATRVYKETTENVPTSKVVSGHDIEGVARQLALSALFVYDMKNKRTRNYEFEWRTVMRPGEKSGIHLQTTYARLCSLIEKVRIKRGLQPYRSMEEINYDSVCCIEGVSLITLMNQLGERLMESYNSLDPSPLVSHALLLCKATNRARRSDWLHVLNEADDQKALSRLTLFESSRAQLEFIIKMIGLQPLCRV